MPLLVDELAGHGLAREAATLRLGEIASLGVLAYAVGKFTNGVLTDFVGGRRSFLGGMGGSVVFTFAFALAGGLPLFTLIWMGNRLVQSMGWPGIVKIVSRWFGHDQYARAMAIVSLSFLFGDAVARAFMGSLITAGLGWRGLFGVTGAVLAGLFLLEVWKLRESPGGSLPEADPTSLYGVDAGELRPAGLADLLRPLLASPTFWLVCGLSLGLTLLRETFNTWTPTFLRDAVGLTVGDAAVTSAVFPLFGGVSVLAMGVAGDRRGGRGRALWITLGLVSATGCLALLGLDGWRDAPLSAVALVAATGFLLIGPYSYLAGAISLQLGGRKGGATVCGIVDGVGYVGGIFAGGGIARIAGADGWGAAFEFLAVVAAATAVLAAVYLRRGRTSQPASGATSG